MCGITGYIGKKQAAPILLRGLEKLEYRGYDSAGIAVRENSAPDAKINIVKAKGRLKALLEKTDCGRAVPGLCGIGHTRWATHGEPSELNAHPHCSDDTVGGAGAQRHHRKLSGDSGKAARKSGYRFYSQTDTEAAVKLIDYYYKTERRTASTAISQAMLRIRGSYALAMMFRDYPRQPLCRPQGQPAHHRPERGTDCYIASDVPAILDSTRTVYYIGNLEMAQLTAGRRPLLQHRPRGDRKGAGADPVGRRSGREGRLRPLHAQGNPRAAAGGARHHPELFKRAGGDRSFRRRAGRRASESSWNASTSWPAALPTTSGTAAKYVIEAMTDLPVEMDLASEFRYRDPKLVKNSLVVIVSQSGETADSLAALRLAKEQGRAGAGHRQRGGLHHRAGERLPAVHLRRAGNLGGHHQGLQRPAGGWSICWPSKLAQVRGCIDEQRCRALIGELAGPAGEDRSGCWRTRSACQWFASKYANAHDIFFIGRGLDYAISLEGSLKMKEISYIHSEAYAAGELKHGTISLIEDGTLVIGVATQQALYEKTVSNLVEVKSRGAYLMGLTSFGNYSHRGHGGLCGLCAQDRALLCGEPGGGAAAADGLLCQRGQGTGCRQTPQPCKIGHGRINKTASFRRTSQMWGALFVPFLPSLPHLKPKN